MGPDARLSAAAPTATRRCALRVDANERIGIGHLTRCLTLATRLRARGVACRFVCRALPEPLHRLVEGHGFPVDALPATTDLPVDDDGPAHRDWLGAGWREDAEQTADVLAAWGGVDVLVVDHYAIDRRWQQRVRRQVRLVAVVDDLADRPHDCELLLDQGFFPDPARRYAGRIPPWCRTVFGPAHALLRPEFAEAAARRRERDGHVRRLLIGYGGSDAGDLTGTTVDALAAHWRGGLEADVVVGALYPHLAELDELCAGFPGVRIHVQTPRMAELIERADLAFGACGTATWERCILGLPSVVSIQAENQRDSTLALAAAGAVVNLGEAATVDAAAIAAAFAALAAAPGRVRAMSEAGLALMHGDGPTFDALLVQTHVFEDGDLLLRFAAHADAADLLAWRNQPEVRRQSRQQAAVDPATHQDWLDRVIADPDRHLLIGYRGGRPVGVLRLDVDGEQGEISIYLTPGSHGAGNGTRLLCALEGWVREQLRQVVTLTAIVLDDNQASHRLFRKAGFTRETARYTKTISP